MSSPGNTIPGQGLRPADDRSQDYRRQVHEALLDQLLRTAPRILSQIDRDPQSPTFGSFDRNYWHYKMRDFSSAVLQQGMLVAYQLTRIDDARNPYRESPLLLELADAALSFLASHQLRNGSFNEYYPNEEGFPPTAFGLYAAALLLRFGAPDSNAATAAHISRRHEHGSASGPATIDHRPSTIAPRYGRPPAEPTLSMLRRSVRWLLSHAETEASNQEAVALAAAALAAQVPGVHVDDAALGRRIDAFLAAQSTEGWWPEYGGADIGYLSVTLDALADLNDVRPDTRIEDAVSRAVRFISNQVTASGQTPVMTNSRNTDYVVPYGLTRAAARDPVAAAVVRALFSRIPSDHFLSRTDDRYACHYVYQSAFRCLPHLASMSAKPAPLPRDAPSRVVLPEAGLVIVHSGTGRSAFVACRKGGVAYVFDRDGVKAADFGWRIRSGSRVLVSHWQDPNLSVSSSASGTVTVSGTMSVHGWLRPTPLRHVALRVLSATLGRRLIPWLKRVLIFGNKASNVRFTRSVTVADDCSLSISDAFDGVASGQSMEPAPHASLRHVSSAAQFCPEELLQPLAPDVSRGPDGRITSTRVLPDVGHVRSATASANPRGSG